MNWTLLLWMALFLAVLHGVFSFLATWAFARVPEDAHWTIRARKLWPSRMQGLAAFILLPLCGMIVARWSGEQIMGYIGGVVIGFLAVSIGGFVATRRLKLPGNTGRNFVRKMIFSMNPLLSPGFLLLLIMGAMMGRPMGPDVWMVAGAFLLWAIFLYTGGYYLLLRLGGFCVPADEALTAEVRACAPDVKNLKVSIWKNEPMAQALAFFWVNAVVLTEGLLQVLTAGEIRAIVRHEVAHLREPLKVRIGRLGGTVQLALCVLILPVMHSRIGLYVVALIGGVFLIGIIQRRLVLKMEYAADDDARQIEPEVYASALTKIYEMNLIPAVVSKKSSGTHPNLYDRIEATGVTPDFPKPAPPAMLVSRLLVFAELGIGGFVLVKYFLMR